MTSNYYKSLTEDEIDEILDIFEYLQGNTKGLLELVATMPMKYLSIIEHNSDCKDLNLPIWTQRIVDNLFVKFKLSDTDRPIEVGFTDSTTDENVANDVRTSIKYWLTHDDQQQSETRRRAMIMGSLENNLPTKSHSQSLPPSQPVKPKTKTENENENEIEIEIENANQQSQMPSQANESGGGSGYTQPETQPPIQLQNKPQFPIQFQNQPQFPIQPQSQFQNPSLIADQPTDYIGFRYPKQLQTCTVTMTDMFGRTSTTTTTSTFY
jgi:hypothetical protein